LKKRVQVYGAGLVATFQHLPRRILLAALRGYKFAISPALLPACRYVPTCSEYAAEAVERYGAVRGVMMAVWRLLRCHPFVRGGFDPVPIKGGACTHIIVANDQTTCDAQQPLQSSLHPHSACSH
jgi:hypothetical protein